MNNNNNHNGNVQTQGMIVVFIFVFIFNVVCLGLLACSTLVVCMVFVLRNFNIGLKDRGIITTTHLLRVNYVNVLVIYSSPTLSVVQWCNLFNNTEKVVQDDLCTRGANKLYIFMIITELFYPPVFNLNLLFLSCSFV